MRCEPYFSRSAGGEHGRFGEEITLSEVLSNDFVIYSLNKNTNPDITIMDQFKIFDAKTLNRKKEFVRRKQGLHSLEIYEEFVRIVEESSEDSMFRSGSVELLKNISQSVSGSRSDNVTIMILLNSMAVFDSKGTKAIESNVTSIIAGKLNPSDIKILEERFNGGDIKHYLKAIATGDIAYKNSFAIRFDNGESVVKALFKAVVSEELEEKLRQRDIKVIDKEISDSTLKLN
jgi:Zn-dependent metalloprotease